MSAPLKLYVKTWCPWCIRAKEYLEKHQYPFEEIDVNHNRAAFDEMILLSGQTYAPTLVADGKILADFGPEELENFLKTECIQPG